MSSCKVVSMLDKTAHPLQPTEIITYSDTTWLCSQFTKINIISDFIPWSRSQAMNKAFSFSSKNSTPWKKQTQWLPSSAQKNGINHRSSKRLQYMQCKLFSDHRLMCITLGLSANRRIQYFYFHSHYLHWFKFDNANKLLDLCTAVSSKDMLPPMCPPRQCSPTQNTNNTLPAVQPAMAYTLWLQVGHAISDPRLTRQLLAIYSVTTVSLQSPANQTTCNSQLKLHVLHM